MNVSNAKLRITRNLSNIPGWRTNRRFIVIESDDWGSVRMPSVEIYNRLKKYGVDVDGPVGKSYNVYDTLASPEDFNALFDLLASFRDKSNNPCVFTALCVVANPDFKKILDHGFSDYYYEPFTDTLNRYYSNNQSFEFWKQGIENRLFVPQFHGREHLNVAEWMRALRDNDRDTHLAFDHGVWGFIRKTGLHAPISYQAAFDFYDPNDLRIQSNSLKEGLALFHDMFGYKATFFVPPNGPFNRFLEGVAAENGIKYLSTPKIQMEPQEQGRKRRVLHWLGQKNQYQQYYLVRNCFFEPWQGSKNWVDSCFKEIEIAFRWHKPAVVSSHRINYIGVHDKRNRDRSLSQLQTLLKKIQKRWPDVEFLTSVQLGKIISETYGD